MNGLEEGRLGSERSERRKAVAVVQVRWTVRAETEADGNGERMDSRDGDEYSRQTENP